MDRALNTGMKWFDFHWCRREILENIADLHCPPNGKYYINKYYININCELIDLTTTQVNSWFICMLKCGTREAASCNS